MHKSLIFILIGVAIVLSVTFASWVVFSEFHPEVEVRKMLLAMSEIESVHQVSQISWTKHGGKGAREISNIWVDSRLRLDDLSKIEHATTFDATHLSAAEILTDLSGEIRSKNEKTYLTYRAPAPDIAGVEFEGKETWIEFEQGELVSWGSILPGIELPLETSRSRTPWSEDSIEHLRYVLRFADVFLVTYDDEKEMIDDTEVRILDARFDEESLRSVLLDFIRARELREPTDAERLFAHNRADQLERLTMRLWIGVEDHLLYRAQAAGAFVLEGSSDLIPIDIKMEFSDFNEAFDVKAPKNPIKFSELLASIFNNLPGAITQIGLRANQSVLSTVDVRLPVQRVEASNDTDGDGLTDIEEAFYGSNPRKKDTDGDGVSDGDEVFAGRSPTGRGSLFGFGLDLLYE